MRDFNAEAKSREDKRYDYDFDAIVRQYMMRAFAPLFAPGPALELGCHEGESTVLFASHFDDLTVVEASSEALAVARTKAPERVTFVNSTIEQLAVNRRFKSIFLINTLEHVDDAQVVLKKVRDWLEPDGRFFVLVPNADAPSRQIAVRMGLIPFNNAITPGEWAHGHRRTYSFDTLEADVRSSGFRVLCRGGLIFKALANFQFDRALESGIISPEYVEGCYNLGMVYPELCASIYLICTPA